MDGWYIKGVPNQFEPVHGLGRPVEVFSSRRTFLAHYGPLALALIAILAALGSLGWGAFFTYIRYFRNGPAVVWRSLTTPVISALILILVGLVALWAVINRWNRTAVLYEGGLAFNRLRGVSTWHWDEISSVQAEVSQLVFLGKAGPITHEYTLVRRNGDKAVLDDSIERVDRLATLIRDKVTPLVLARYTQAFESGLTLHFGPIQLSLREGIRVRSYVYDWSAVEEIAVQNGQLQIKLAPDGKNDPQQPRILASQVPNLDVLLSFTNKR